jgi:hypothetical protein
MVCAGACPGARGFIKINGAEVIDFSEKVGDYFGEVALLYDRPRAANVIADGKMKALVR